MAGEYRQLGEADAQAPLFGAGQFAALSAAAHDLKAPLSSVRYMAATLRDAKTNLTKTQQNDYLWRIELTARRSLQLVEGLTYAYSTSQLELDLEPVNVAQVCDDVLHEMSPLARQLAQTIELKLPRTGSLALAHYTLLNSVITGLCDNALKHNPPESHVLVRVSCERQAIQVAVRDSGPKISSRDFRLLKSRLGNQLNPLSGRAGDSGLGLYVASQLARAMQGQLNLHRHQSGGMTFALQLQPSCQLSLL